MSKGYVYILSNPALPGLVKIGFSFEGGAKRRSQLSNTGLPHPFELVFEISSHDPVRLEGAVHRNLREYRENQRREFFRLDETAAIMALIDNWLRAAGYDADYFNAWLNHTTHFEPAKPVELPPEPTEEEKQRTKERARATLARISDMLDQPSQGAQ